MFHSGALVKIGDYSFIRRAEIDLAQDGSPPTRASKLEDLRGRVTVSKNGVIAVVMIAGELGHCVALEPFVSLADQFPAVLACQRGFQFEREGGDVWSSDVCVREIWMKSAGEALFQRVQQRAGTDPEIGDEFAEQAAELQRARDRVMFTRAELAAKPGVHLRGR